MVEADRTYLDLLVGNLLSNADTYGPRTQLIEVVLSADAVDARTDRFRSKILSGAHVRI